MMSGNSSFTSIPIIDLSHAGDDDKRLQMLDDLRYALTSVGFLYVKNHGVPSATIQNIVRLVPSLFDLPDDDKEKVALHKSSHFLGYSTVGSETTAGKVDQREQFEFATELSASWTEGEPVSERLRGPNQWPESLPRAKQIIQQYISDLTDLSKQFLTLVTMALNLPAMSLHSFLSDQHRLKIVRYPGGESGELVQGVGPHKDSSGWWTFLLQASPPEVKGLQALNKDGNWIDVPNIPGTLVVNIGQAFEVVTRGACKATTHRVLIGDVERYSLPFFQGVRRNLTKDEALNTFADHFNTEGIESNEGAEIDSAFLRGKYNTWGESQLRTKIRSHKDVGKRYYADVYEKYVNDE